ncbi:MAG: YigZ family protein [Peptostreptococcaceae bacterium]|nr:YigZ family protein [Peptostreptococcaceae bacterium]
MKNEYQTLRGPASWEDEIKKSKFIAYVKPVETEKEANEFVDAIKKRHKDARHNVPIFVLGEEQEMQRYSDDGEPSGTAGIPILEMIKNKGLTNLVVVVTRYFGGIKLGTGGLVRAYTHVAQRALDEAGIVSKTLMLKVVVKVDYSMHGKVKNFLYDSKYILDKTEFDDSVHMFIYARPEDEDEFTNSIVNITNGKAEMERSDAGFHIIEDGKLLD